MRTTLIICTALATAILCGADARAADSRASAADAVSVTDVLAMMDTMPSAPGDPKTHAYPWSKKRGAATVAQAIAATAPDREWAARMAIYAVHESALSTECLAGDGGKSRGPWQLQGASSAVACDAMQAAPVWLAMAQRSIADCATLPVAERMAELTSGSCARGRQLARLRETFVLRALAQALPPASSDSIE
jgi:hypothetical protein